MSCSSRESAHLVSGPRVLSLIENFRRSHGSPARRQSRRYMLRHVHRWSGPWAAPLLLALATRLAAQAPDSKVAAPEPVSAPEPPKLSDVIVRDETGRVTIRAQRIAAPLRIDGELQEAAYSLPSFSGFIQAEPRNGESATERTEA